MSKYNLEAISKRQRFMLATYQARQQARAWALRQPYADMVKPNFARRLLRYYRTRQQAALIALTPASSAKVTYWRMPPR